MNINIIFITLIVIIAVPFLKALYKALSFLKTLNDFPLMEIFIPGNIKRDIGFYGALIVLLIVLFLFNYYGAFV